jgi:hypothetical protein
MNIPLRVTSYLSTSVSNSRAIAIDWVLKRQHRHQNYCGVGGRLCFPLYAFPFSASGYFPILKDEFWIEPQVLSIYSITRLVALAPPAAPGCPTNCQTLHVAPRHPFPPDHHFER